MKNRKAARLGFGTLVLIALVVIGLLVSSDFEGKKLRNVGPAHSDAAAIYAENSIRFIVPSAPGGGFDEYSRLLAPFLEKYSGATVRVENLPGAGGLRVVNELYHSPKNGLTVAIMNGTAMVAMQLANLNGADYRIEDFAYLGRVVADSRVLSVTAESEIASIEDIWLADEIVKIGATGLGGNAYVDGVISKEALNLSIQIIHGFDSSSSVRQAMLQGKISGTWGSWGSARESVSSGLEKVILQSGRERIEELLTVPTVFELANRTENPERTDAILTAWDALNSVGRPVATTPGTPADRVLFLGTVFRSAMHDPDFLSAADRAGRATNYASGEEIARIINDATRMQEDIAQLFRRATRGDL